MQWARVPACINPFVHKHVHVYLKCFYNITENTACTKINKFVIFLPLSIAKVSKIIIVPCAILIVIIILSCTLHFVIMFT